MLIKQTQKLNSGSGSEVWCFWLVRAEMLIESFQIVDIYSLLDASLNSRDLWHIMYLITKLSLRLVILWCSHRGDFKTILTYCYTVMKQANNSETTGSLRPETTRDQTVVIPQNSIEIMRQARSGGKQPSPFQRYVTLALLEY